MSDSRTLLVGAGAEVPLQLGSGQDFTLETFYRKNRNLYDALTKYYDFNHISGRKVIPAYSQQTLLTTSSRLFKTVLISVLKDVKLSEAMLSKDLDRGLKKRMCDATSYLQADASLPDKFFTNEDCRKLMSLFFEDECVTKLIKQHNLLDKTHYGILEEYYSSLIRPASKPHVFWKLINFYWNAFFFIVRPILDNNIDRAPSTWEPKDYLHVLDNLEETIATIYSTAEDAIRQHGYGYHRESVAGCFNNIITTNYTPYSAHFLKNPKREDAKHKIAWLSGQLCQFERFDTLSTFDIRDNPALASDHQIFPFLMCQSPVKSIVNTVQIQEYAKAMGFLTEAHEIAVLGYSFCEEDTHISTLVSEALANDHDMQLVYFHYTTRATELEQSTILQNLSKRLGMNSCRTTKQIRIIMLQDDMKTFSTTRQERDSTGRTLRALDAA